MITFSPWQRRMLWLSLPIFGLLAALLIVLFCVIVFIVLAEKPPQNDLLNFERTLFLCAAVAGALCSMLFWWLCVVRIWRWLCTYPKGIAVLFGALAGLASTICAHPLMWFFWLIYTAIVDHITGSALLLLPVSCLVFSLWSLLLFGISTYGTMFFIGIAFGALFALLMRFKLSPVVTPPLPA